MMLGQLTFGEMTSRRCEIIEGLTMAFYFSGIPSLLTSTAPTSVSSYQVRRGSKPGNTKWESITVPLTSYFIGLD
jgi:hypothetical protein